MVMPYKLIFNTTLLFPNQIHSSLPHPSVWQWWMAAFTRLSPLHISLPIRLTTHIHTLWLFIPLSFHLPQTPALPHILSSSHYWVSFSSNLPPLLQPSCALFFHFLLFLSLPLTVFHAVSLSLHPSFVVRFHIPYWYPCLPVLSIHPGWLKRTEYDRNDRGVIVSKGWVGLQYTRLPRKEAMWAFFCSSPRERESVCVCLPIIMIVWEDCFGMLVVVFVCKCSPNIKGLDYE